MPLLWRPRAATPGRLCEQPAGTAARPSYWAMEERMRQPAVCRLGLALACVGALACGGSEEYKAREATKAARDVKVQERMAAREHEATKQAEAKAAADDAAWRKSAAFKVQQKHPDWSRFVCEAVAKRAVFVGMTAEQAVASWGKPRHTSERTTAEATHEVWCYDAACKQKLGLTDGKVALIER